MNESDLLVCTTCGHKHTLGSRVAFGMEGVDVVFGCPACGAQGYKQIAEPDA